MYFADYRLARIVMEARVEEALKQAGRRDLHSQVQVEPGGWLSKRGRRLLRETGHLLIASGERLTQYAATQRLSAKVEIGRGL
jgi:hypothetical protein